MGGLLSIIRNEFDYSRSSVPQKLKATVPKIAHHGSETSSTIPFVEAVDPDLMITQLSRKSFGRTFLTDRSAIERYCSHNSQVNLPHRPGR